MKPNLILNRKLQTSGWQNSSAVSFFSHSTNPTGCRRSLALMPWGSSTQRHCSLPPHLGVNPSIPHAGSNQPAGFQPSLQLAKLIRPLVARKAFVASCKADTPCRPCQRSAVISWPAVSPPARQGPAERSKEKWWASQGFCRGEGEGGERGGKEGRRVWGRRFRTGRGELPAVVKADCSWQAGWTGKKRCWISTEM